MYQEDEFLRLKRLLSIDRNNLDEEFSRIPEVLMEVTEHLVHAEYLRDKAASDVKVAKAETAAEMRQEIVGGKPRSESSITSGLDAEQSIRAAVGKALETALDYGMWSGLVSSVKQKSYSLNGMSDLTVAGYMTPNSGKRPYDAGAAEYERQRESMHQQRIEKPPSKRVRVT